MTRVRPVARLASLMLLAAVLVACGKKGPPLAPVLILPARIAPPEISRLGDRVYVQFTVPSTDTDQTTPADIERVEVYALTTQPTDRRPREPFSEDWLDAATLIATLPVRPPGAPAPTATENEEGGDADAAAAGIVTVDDGFVGQGERVTVVERLTSDALIPVTVGDPDEDDEADEDEPDADADRIAPRPLVAPALPRPPIRSYVAFGISSRRREGDASSMVAVPLVAPPPPPGVVTVSYTAESARVTWAAPDTLRAAVQDETVVPPTLESTPILEGLEPSEYVLYDIRSTGDPDIEPPTEMTSPLSSTSYTDVDVEFGTTKCYVVRILDHVGELEVLGDESPATCVVLTDTFPPAAPTGLLAVANAGTISLVWNENTEPDIAGYVVLRGRTSDATLQPLTVEPVEETAFRDSDVELGERYIYQVRAVDTATPPNVSPPSDQIVETAR